MKLNNPLITPIEFEGVEYSLDLAFDNVLDLFDVLDDKALYDHEKVMICLRLLLDEQKTEQPFELWEYIYTNYIIQEVKEPIKYDLLGNPMPVENEEESDESYDIEQDAEYIYASFRQAYNINLFDEQGKMQWIEFKALLNGLPSNTILQKIIQIRNWKPSKHDSADTKENMEKLQNVYRLRKEE